MKNEKKIRLNLFEIFYRNILFIYGFWHGVIILFFSGTYAGKIEFSLILGTPFTTEIKLVFYNFFVYRDILYLVFFIYYFKTKLTFC